MHKYSPPLDFSTFCHGITTDQNLFYILTGVILYKCYKCAYSYKTVKKDIYKNIRCDKGAEISHSTAPQHTKTRLITRADRTFAVAVPNLWNNHYYYLFMISHKICPVFSTV